MMMLMVQKSSLLIILVAALLKSTLALKHHLVLTGDPRVYATVSSFGYLLGGELDVIVQNLTLTPDPSEVTDVPAQFGFVLIKSPDHMTNPYLIDPENENNESHLSTCMAQHLNTKHYGLIRMGIYPDSKVVRVSYHGDHHLPHIRSLPRKDDNNNNNNNINNYDKNLDHNSYVHNHHKRAAGLITGSPLSNNNSNNLSPNYKNKNNNYDSSDDNSLNIPEQMKSNFKHDSQDLPLIITTDQFSRRTYQFNFSMFIRSDQEEGFYYLMFHNCRGIRALSSRMQETPTRFNLSMLIWETNYPEIFLSAGSIPLPQMYFVLSIMFLLIGCIWVNFIARQKESTLRIHHLMTVLVFAKSCSLLFHGINFHYIALYGQPAVTWAYLYYATRSIKGALFFITLVLIGSGWSFIKHILSDKDKKIILIVVGLQVVAHIAEIVLDESTEGQISYEVSAQICSLIDLICCLVILYPITLSVRHLEEASRTDGKAAINLKKLELFKRFYIISTIYIYVTRIITFIFLGILSYRYSWLAQLVSEFATLIYFITTGYYFQPMPTNPYLLLSSDNNDLEEDILFSVDDPEFNGTQLDNLSGTASQHRDQDTDTLFNDSGKHKVTRRLLDDHIV